MRLAPQAKRKSKKAALKPKPVKKAVRVKQEDYGRYQLNQRLNVDQVPFNLDNCARRCYVDKSTEQAQVSSLPGADKRFGTLQICVHPGEGHNSPKKANKQTETHTHTHTSKQTNKQANKQTIK